MSNLNTDIRAFLLQCAVNTIAVSFVLDGLLASACASRITISGLVGAVDAATSLTLLSPATSGAFELSPQWEQGSGTVTVSLSSNLQGDTAYTLSFELHNSAWSQDATAVTFEEPIIVGQGPQPVSGSVIVVDDVSFAKALIGDISTEPCGPNTLTITFIPSIDLNSGCKKIGANGEEQNAIAFLEINGLTGSSSSSVPIDVVANIANKFNGQGNFDADAGNLVRFVVMIFNIPHLHLQHINSYYCKVSTDTFVICTADPVHQRQSSQGRRIHPAI